MTLAAAPRNEGALASGVIKMGSGTGSHHHGREHRAMHGENNVCRSLGGHLDARERWYSTMGGSILALVWAVELLERALWDYSRQRGCLRSTTSLLCKCRLVFLRGGQIVSGTPSQHDATVGWSKCLEPRGEQCTYTRLGDFPPLFTQGEGQSLGWTWIDLHLRGRSHELRRG